MDDTQLFKEYQQFCMCYVNPPSFATFKANHERELAGIIPEWKKEIMQEFAKKNITFESPSN